MIKLLYYGSTLRVSHYYCTSDVSAVLGKAMVMSLSQASLRLNLYALRFMSHCNNMQKFQQDFADAMTAWCSNSTKQAS